MWCWSWWCWSWWCCWPRQDELVKRPSGRRKRTRPMRSLTCIVGLGILLPLFHAVPCLASSSSSSPSSASSPSSSLRDHSELYHPIREFDPNRLNFVLFGSCNDESKDQRLWQTLLNQKPDLWVFSGDNIYADMKRFHEWRAWIPPVKLFEEATPDTLYGHYDRLLHDTYFEPFHQSVPMIGVYDDHDFGINDGCKTYTYRKESQKLFLDFIGEPKQSKRRQQEGVYTTYVFGHGDDDTQVRFIILDGRFHKDPYGTVHGDFLGPAQWTWLEETLGTTKAAFNVIVSGIQVIPDDRYGMGEYWGRFPRQRERLLNLILHSNAKGVLLLSGDVHFSEANALECPEARRVHEITCSGLTHSWHKFQVLPLFFRTLFKLANWLLPFEYRTKQQHHYGDVNFGGLRFDWDAQPRPILTASSYDQSGKPRFSIEVVSVDYQQQQHGNTYRYNVTDCKAPRACSGTVTRVLWLALFLTTVAVLVVCAVACGLALLRFNVWCAKVCLRTLLQHTRRQETANEKSKVS